MRKSRLVVVLSVALTALIVLPIAYAVGARRAAGPSPTDLALINGVMQLVQHDYVHPVDADTLTKDALKGMLNRLDPHSDYMDEQEFKESEADIAGKFGGLGIQISEDHGVPKVISPIDGTPAARAGLQPGDLIVGINGESAQGMDLSKVVRLLRGAPGSSVKITIVRGTQKPFDVTITRAIIQVQTVKSKLEPNNIGYVRITEFGGDTPRDFKQAIEKMKQEAGGSLRGLVLDLRNDPGGLLSSAVAVAGDFLNGGTVVTIKGRNGNDNHAYKADGGGDLIPHTPIVVLINGASASASEIVAGALQDRQRATIMGTQSFGKGSVQTIIPLEGHGALRLTTALYYTPAGRSIQGQGIAPNVVVKVPEDQQVAGAFMPHEQSLNGAFRNPGPLTGTGKSQSNPGKPAVTAEANSAPIKADLIGTPQDAQLKAALAFFAPKTPSSTTGRG
ncbi:MAG TPA: S41 family peptidase [Pseudolabrys sp.]|jgi:carboxyl-terminal processing protease|nr:S41 family peptidase [Pseudolabrys sp.]